MNLPERIEAVLIAGVLLMGAIGCRATPPNPTVADPHVTTDQSIDCSTVDRILESLIRDGMTDEQKVLTVYNWVRRLIYHGDGHRRHAYDFHFMINVAGNGSCGRQTTPAALLLSRLGYRTQNWTRGGHHLMQVFYGGKWHCLDPHMNFYVYDRSTPRSIASVEQLQQDPSLALDAVKEGRACPGFLLCGDSPKTFAGQGGWKLYGEYPKGFHKPRLVEPFGRIVLRRGETYVRTWMPGTHWYKKNCWIKDSGPFHTCGGRDRKDTVNWPLYEPHAARLKYGPVYRHWGAGRIKYAPDLSGDHYADAAVRQNNLRPGAYLGGGALRPVDPEQGSEIVFSVQCPYVITAGELSLERIGRGAVVASVSTDRGKSWRPVQVKAEGQAVSAAFVDEVNGALDGYWLRLVLSPGTGLAGLKLTSEFQLNPYSLPYLVPGKNAVTVAARSYGSPLTVTYEWAEGPDWAQPRSASKTFRTDGAFTVQVAGPKYPRMKSLTLSVAP